MVRRDLKKLHTTDQRPIELSNPGPMRVIADAVAQMSPILAIPNAFASALEARQANKVLQEFLVRLQDDLLAIEGDLERVINRLESCEGFPALLVRMLEDVRRTADNEKIDMLRHATVNLTYSDIEISEKEQLAKIITDLTAIDIKVLQFYRDIDWDDFDKEFVLTKLIDQAGEIGRNRPYGSDAGNQYLGQNIAKLGLNKNFVPLSIRKLVQFELLNEMAFGTGYIIDGQLNLPRSEVMPLGRAILDLLAQVPPPGTAP